MARRAIRTSLAAAALLFAMLSVLAWLQFRWIGEVRDGELERMRASTRSAAESVALDFDREVARALRLFGEPLPAREPGDLAAPLAAARERWSAEAKFPSLVSQILVARRGGDRAWTLAHLDATGGLEPAAWTQELSRVKQALDEEPPSVHRFAPAGPPPRFPFPRVVTDPPALLVESSGSEAITRTAVIVLLDREAISTRVLPELVERHFGQRTDYDVAVLSRPDADAVVYRSRAALSPGEKGRPDAEVPLLAPRPGRDPADRAAGGHSPDGLLPPGPPPERFGGPPRGTGGRPAWTLVAWHRAGSLDAAVEVIRKRNLAVSGGILLLLAAAVGVLLSSAHRAGRLARQQVEFVASLTHELRTPLAAIRSAGQNLTDGVVVGEARVQEYGRLIDKEGRRLSALIETALAQAGIQTRGESLRAGSASIPETIEAAIAACRPLAEEHRARVETAIPPDLPLVAGDETALRTLMENLLSNAIKYGREDGRVAIEATADERSVHVAVRDGGPGIPRDDLPRIFEPFYRGSRAGGVGGTGLGLSLVRRIVDALGGRIAIQSRPGEGTTFTVTLPRAQVQPA